MKNRFIATLGFAVALGGSVLAQQNNPLAAARDLYASARYDEALAVLNGMKPAPGEVSDRKSIEQYRSLCLLALGRGTEAENAIAAVVTVDPLFVPAEASPRVRAAFSDVRKRLLPDIATARYASAKAAYDRKDYATAEGSFKNLLVLLDDPQMGGRLPDLRVLASGFLDLSTAAAAPPPEPKPEPPAPAPPIAPAAPVFSPSRIWAAEDEGVTPPVSIKQDVPRVSRTVANQARDTGLLELVIDEQGRVTGITVRVSVHPMYDAALMSAARSWRYQPATVNGVPVKYRQLVRINVTRQ